MRQASAILEIGTSKVVSIISEIGQSDTHILGSASVAYARYKNRKWVDRHALAPAVAAALREAEKKAGKRCRQIHVGIPADFVSIVCKKVELTFSSHKTITEADLEQLYQKGRSNLNVPKDMIMLHRCPVLFYLDDARRTMEPLGRKASRIAAVISYVLAEKWFTSGVAGILNRCGCTVSTYIAASYAEAMKFIPREKRDHGAVMIDIGAHSTCVMVVRGDGLVFHRVLPFGGANITGDLEKVFHLNRAMAEELKKRSIYGLSLGEDDCYEVCDKETYRFERFSAIRVQEVIEARMQEMLRILVQTLDQSGCALPSYMPVYLTGGGAMMRGLREFVQRQINRTTLIVQPQSTSFNQPCYSSALATMELSLDVDADDEPGFFENIRNLLGI